MEEATFCAAAPMPLADLPLNIWVEIFHKLPLIWVGRCLRVCKQWFRLISDPLFASNYNPNFIRNHRISLLMECWCSQHLDVTRRIHETAYDLILLNEAFKKVTTKKGMKCFATSKSLERRLFRSRGDFFVKAQERCTVTILGSCNGLVALYKDPGDFLLFNPCTKDEKWVRLDTHQAYAIGGFFRFYGLCHDPARDEYKVVMCGYTSFCVVSLKDGSFSKFKAQSHLLQSLKYYKWQMELGRPTTVRGVPHWAAELVDAGGDVIVYFDPLAKELQMVRFPKPKLKNFWALDGFELGALDGQMTLSLDIGKGYEVWALKEYRNEPCWSMLFVIPISCRAFEILSRVSDDEILVFGTFLKVYNIKTQRSRKLLLSNGSHLITSYIPSLASPNH